MLREFTRGTQTFQVKTLFDPERPEEVIVKFQYISNVEDFFNNAMKGQGNNTKILAIAKDVAPKYCCPPKYWRPPSNDSLLNQFYKDVYAGKIRLVMKDIGISLAKITDGVKKGSEGIITAGTSFIVHAEKSAKHLKDALRKMVHTDYYAIEYACHFDENSPHTYTNVDLTSAQEVSSGWKPWDDPIETTAFTLFKGYAGWRTGGLIPKIGPITKVYVGGSALASNKCTMQYLLKGYLVNSYNWYGSFKLGFNIRTGHWEIHSIKYNKKGPLEKRWVGLTRKDRMMMGSTVAKEFEEQLFPMHQKWQDFVETRQKKCPNLPEHDSNKSIYLGTLFDGSFRNATPF